MAHSDETKEKIRRALLGNKNAAGIIPSKETREKIRQTKLGGKNPNFGKPSHNRGKPMSDQAKRKLSAARMGQPAWNKGQKGLRPWMNLEGLQEGRGWNRGKRKPEALCTSSKNARLRRTLRYTNWRKAVFHRDKYTCVSCGSKGYIEADHIKPFASHPKLRFDINNGRTLCKPCHKKTDTYGFRGFKKVV